MSRLLGIDYGDKRVGVAVTDPNQIISSPLDTIDTNKIFMFLKNYFDNEKVSGIVIGWPLDLNGKETLMTQKIDQFMKKLKKEFPQMLLYKYDERFTSKIALDSIIIGIKKKKNRRDKKIVDKVSAALILRSFLEQQNNKFNM